MPKIPFSFLQYRGPVQLKKRYAEKLRGYFAGLYRNIDLFHNHTAEGRVLYRYPLIQYKIIDGNPVVIGLNEGAELVKNEFIKHDRLILGDVVYEHFETVLDYKTVDFDVSDTLYEYQFSSLWLPLNEENYRLYQRGGFDLNTGLQNNLLSDLKGLGIWTDKRIMAKGKFVEHEVFLENQKMIGFAGDFVCNVRIPDYMGTGKRKSIGFGVIVGK